MNGAMAELCARINSTANRQSVIRIGVIHQRLLLQKNENSSPAIPNRWPVVFKKPITDLSLLELHQCDGKRLQFGCQIPLRRPILHHTEKKKLEKIVLAPERIPG